MEWFVLLALVAVMALLRVLEVMGRLRVGMLGWLAAWWVGIFLALRYGFTVPAPASVVKIYMGIATLALAAYVLADRERIREVKEPLVSFMTEKRYQPFLVAVALLIPLAFAIATYAGMVKEPSAPNFARTIHPAMKEQITVLGQDMNLVRQENPFRELETEDPEGFAEHAAAGKEVYYKNCFYCHGDILAGDGMFAHALNPIPSNFQDINVLPILTESFVFWRISKGAPGLPEEAGPWDSAMPAWENFLTVDEMWDVVLFLYDYTGRPPRALEEVH